MKNSARILLLFLMLSLLAASAASCKPGETTGTSEASTSSGSEKAELFSNLPEVNYGGEEILILVEGDHHQLYASVEVMPNESSPAIISDSVRTRNLLVEERFGVTIKEERTTSGSGMVTTIRANNMAGSDMYDIVMPFIPDAASLAGSGDLLLLDDSNIHLDEPYWDQRAVSGLSINNKTYFATGDFSLLTMGCTHAIAFNKDVAAEHGYDNIYELVEQGKWTYDELVKMARTITAETDGTAGMGVNDTYGFLINSNYVTSMYISSGERLTGKTAADLPELTVGTGRGVSVFNKIFEIVNDKTATGQIESFTGQVDNIWLAATEAVANKRVLFRAMSIIDMPELGDYECRFGILPTPKFEEDQSDYYSLVSVIAASCAAIPSSNAEPEKAAIILDALCQASTDTIKHNYYQVMLKDRKIQDDESEEMLDLIFGNRVYDLGIVYGWGGVALYDQNSVGNFMNIIAYSGSNTFTSRLESISGAVQTAIDTTISQFQ